MRDRKRRAVWASGSIRSDPVRLSESLDKAIHELGYREAEVSTKQAGLSSETEAAQS